ncbi:GntR family transcriptional regulator [Longispora albida]|uniref:GntR family transcriptional regulator n=1 Tax=Longispora albida TaxID=203523 RepID=UPI00036F72F6|nr:GntR family transcriptional regulator [Longispora albida]
MSVNPGATEWPHRQIADQIRAKIQAGDWGPGEKLPSIPDIGHIYGVAKQTAQRAIDQLRIEGLLITRPGSGTYVRGVRRRLARLARGRYGTTRGYHTDPGARYRQRLTLVGRAPAPHEVAAAFGVAEGTELLVRRAVITSQEQVVEVSATWLRASEVAGSALEGLAPLTRPLYQEVEEVTGRQYVYATDQLSARLPHRDEAETLQIRADTPVLTLLHIGYDGQRHPIEVTQSTWPGPTTLLTDDYKVPSPRHEPEDGPDLALA